jgi:hypothetical protein
MKTMAHILLVTVLFLAFKPAVDYVIESGCHKVACCVDECNPFQTSDSGQNDPNDCDGNACNPFQVCGNSFVYTSDQSGLNTEPKVVFATKKFMYRVSYASQFLPEFWQPPKIV